MQETYSLYNYYFDQYLPGDDHYFWIKCAPLQQGEERPKLSNSCFDAVGGPNRKRYDYSLDLQTWTEVPYRTDIEFDDVIYLRSHYSSNSADRDYAKIPLMFKVNKPHSIGGNIDLMVFKNDVPLTEANLPNTFSRDPNFYGSAFGIFGYLFYEDTNLISAKCVKFHEGTVMKRCMFTYMFYGCTNLRNCFKLPSGDLYEGSCAGMFWNCYNLKELPALPEYVISSTVTNQWGYRYNPCDAIGNMFTRCGSMVLKETQVSDTYKPYTLPIVKPNSYWENSWDDEVSIWSSRNGLQGIHVDLKVQQAPILYTNQRIK